MYNSSELIGILIKGMDEISKVNKTKEINARIDKLMTELTGSEKSELFLFDNKKNKLFPNGNEKDGFDIDTLGGIFGKTVSMMKPSFYNHIRSEKYYDEVVDNPAGMKLKAQLIYPIIDERKNCGVLRVSRTIQMSKNYTQNDITLLKSIEPYIIKMVHVLKNDRKRVDVDESKVSAQIKELEKNTKKTNKEINEGMLFLSNTVHDIRTPANSLYGFLDMLEEQINDKKLLKFVQNAKQSAEFINTLTDTILERVKYENEVRTSEVEKVNSVSFFANTANIFSANMTTKGIHYLVIIDPTIPKDIKVETVKLKRVLINLIGNAYKFTPAGKTIELYVVYNAEKKKLRIEIKDTGLGIEESRQKEIFEAFKQAKEDTSINHGGTGLGLAICSKYVSELGGELKLESKLDEGSNFFFEIPVDIVDLAPAYARHQNFNKMITIYTDGNFSIDANHMKWYLERCGIPSEKIEISNKIKRSTTHLISFEHKLNDSVVKVAEENNIKLILFEEKLFSLSKQEKYKEFPILSKNNYYNDTLYSSISSKHRPTALVVDDSKLNVQLLESMLDGEYCDITVKYSGDEGFIALQESLLKGQPFDILFSDKHMDGMNGTDMLRSYREMELNHPEQKPIYAVSITGDAKVAKEDRELYNVLLHKPFNRAQVVNVLKQV